MRLGTDFFDASQPPHRDAVVRNVPVVFTGPLDRYFADRLGPLSWRTLGFELYVEPVRDFQATPVMNYSDLDVPFTRIHEFRHFHPERNYTSPSTVIMKEYSQFAGSADEPHYPVNTAEDRRSCSATASSPIRSTRSCSAAGWATYQCLDMHMARASALSRFESVLRAWFRSGPG